MRTLALLLSMASALFADEADAIAARLRTALRQERFQAALEQADAALARFPGDATMRYRRAEAIVGLARDLQRAKGYPAAIARLEPELTDPFLAQAYAEACLWGGQELRGVAHLRASALPVRQRILPEFLLLKQLRRFDELAARAAETGETAWAEWAEERMRLQERLRGRGRRGWIVAAAAFAALVLGALVLLRLAPPRRAQDATRVPS